MSKLTRALPCVFMGKRTGETVPCPPPRRCGQLVFSCPHYGQCTFGLNSVQIQSCQTCPSYIVGNLVPSRRSEK